MIEREREIVIKVPSTAYTMHGMDKYTSYDIRVEAEGEKVSSIISILESTLIDRALVSHRIP